MKKLILLLSVLAFSCSKSPKDNPKLVEANKIHLEAVEIQELVEKKIKTLDSLNAISKDAVLKDKIENSKKLFEEWKASMIEIEGFEHHHDHEGHHHDHKPAPEMTDDSMIDYQKNTKKAIEELNLEIDNILKEIKK
jgi:hypothetical protein